MNKITIIASILLYSALNSNIFGMETPVNVPTIVDHNAGQTIATEITKETPIIGVFGATPRYSALERYMRNLTEHFQAVSNQYGNYVGKKKMKGFDKNVRDFITKVDKKPGIEVVRNLINNSSEAERCELFFAAGLEHETLQKNIKTLLESVQKVGKDFSDNNAGTAKLHLAHMLLPSYFADVSHLSTNPKAPELLHGFLKQSAAFYQKMYTQVATKDTAVPTTIVIPHIKHFTNMITRPDEDVDKAKSTDMLGINLAVFKEDLRDLLDTPEGYVFFDQDSEELHKMIETLQKKGMEKVAGRGIPIKNNLGYPTTIFHPYVLKADKTYSYQNSPIFNEQFSRFIQNKYQ